ncbi:MAG: hypothetical protein IJK04_14530, partial [Kiritimatiellae bacterium]|nr:hypothetical protein [Kiritimatiellia bacterium]
RLHGPPRHRDDDQAPQGVRSASTPKSPTPATVPLRHGRVRFSLRLGVEIPRGNLTSARRALQGGGGLQTAETLPLLAEFSTKYLFEISILKMKLFRVSALPRPWRSHPSQVCPAFVS